MIKNIVIVGMSGVGKTTTAKLLAQKINLEFIDLDSQIESSCGVSIATIFAKHGERFFRQLEEQELQKVINHKNNYVLSLGGGALTNCSNREILTQNQPNKIYIIYLDADLSLIISRNLSDMVSTRPLFANLSNPEIAAKIKELYDKRQPMYTAISNLTLNISHLNPQQVVNKLFLCIK